MSSNDLLEHAAEYLMLMNSVFIKTQPAILQTFNMDKDEYNEILDSLEQWNKDYFKLKGNE